MKADATLRESYTWSTFALLSAECSLEEKVRSEDGEWLAGMAVRIVDVDVTQVDRKVDADTLRLIDQIEQHYGHAGPAFVSAMISQGGHRQAQALRDKVLAAGREIAGTNADSALARAATPFALLAIAGDLAMALGIIPQEARVHEAVLWAWDRFRHSSDSRALDPEAQAVENLRRYIAERWDVTIRPTGPMTGNREVLGWYDEIAVYIPKERMREATGGVLPEPHIGAMLSSRGLLAKRSGPDRFTVSWVPKVSRITAYALTRSEFGRSEAVQDPERILTIIKDAADD